MYFSSNKTVLFQTGTSPIVGGSSVLGAGVVAEPDGTVGAEVSSPDGVWYAGVGVSALPAVELVVAILDAGVVAEPGAGAGYTGNTGGAGVARPDGVSYIWFGGCSGAGFWGAEGLGVRQNEAPWTKEGTPQEATTTTISKSFTIENDN